MNYNQVKLLLINCCCKLTVNETDKKMYSSSLVESTEPFNKAIESTN